MRLAARPCSLGNVFLLIVFHEQRFPGGREKEREKERKRERERERAKGCWRAWCTLCAAAPSICTLKHVFCSYPLCGHALE